MCNKTNAFRIKKYIIKTLLLINLVIISIWFSFSNTYAEGSWSVIFVTEKIPWAGCELQEKKPNKGQYKCNVERWFWSIMNIMSKMLKYFTFISWLLAVLTIVFWWIAYSMWWADDWLKTKSKDFIVKSLMWLIILLLSWTILYAVAPWVYN